MCIIFMLATHVKHDYKLSILIASINTTYLPVSASACVVFTADEGVRGGKVIPLKKMVDEALEGCECVKKVYVYKRTGADVPMKSERDVVLDEVSLAVRE